MSDTLRFPRPTTTEAGASEVSQIITLSDTIVQIDQGGPATYADITPWHLVNKGFETPYCDIAIEFTADVGLTIGDGTPAQMIGLYGEILLGPGAGRYLLGVLGISLANGAKPQIPIFSATNGFAQVVTKVAVYDGLAVGGILGDIPIGDEHTITIRARPIRFRSYGG